jgi:hypothetical protein
MNIRSLLMLILAANAYPCLADEAKLFAYLNDEIDKSSSQYTSVAAISTHLVQIDIKALSSKQPISILMPDDVNYYALSPVVQKHGLNSLTWRSTIVGPEGLKGTATITIVDGVVAGTIEIQTMKYTLAPYKGNISLLQKIDDALFPPDQHPIDPALDTELKLKHPESEPGNSHAVPRPDNYDPPPSNSEN